MKTATKAPRVPAERKTPPARGSHGKKPPTRQNAKERPSQTTRWDGTTAAVWELLEEAAEFAIELGEDLPGFVACARCAFEGEMKHAAWCATGVHPKPGEKTKPSSHLPPPRKEQTR